MPLDHLFGADKGDLVIYASKLETMLEEAIRVTLRYRADHSYGLELDAEYGRAKAVMVIAERERASGAA